MSNTLQIDSPTKVNNSNNLNDSNTSNLCSNTVKNNNECFKGKNTKPVNLPLLIFDALCLPIHIVRMMLIYFFGSKYNLKGFRFLDVIMHADNPYFNQADCKSVDTVGTDYRIVIRDDSRIFPLDLNKYFELKQTELIPTKLTHNSVNTNKIDRIITGSTQDDFDTQENNIKHINKTHNVLDSIRDELNDVLTE